MSGDTKLLLIVEDDADNASVLREVLEEEGYAITRATDGADALRLLGEGLHPGLVLMDLMMPNLDGLHLAEQLRKDPRWSKLPLVLLSADRRAGLAASEAGINAFLNKPVALDRLIDAVATHYRNPENA